jgi:YihY family inner membrane protein
MTALVAVQGVIGLVGLAAVLNKGGVSDIIVATVRRAVPGPAGQILTTAVAQAHSTAAEHRYSAVIVGVLGCLVTGTTALGQLERGLNRIYGVEQDRPTVHKYGRAFFFALIVGTLASFSFGCLAFGRQLFQGGSHGLSTVWTIGRWPLGLALIAVAITFLFRWSPRRCQPRLSWLAFGAAISVVLWALATAGLGFFYGLSSSFGQTYGPLAGMIALLVWCLLSSIALFYGAAVAAQLEGVRAGESAPQDAEKVSDSEPDAQAAPAAAAARVKVAS